MMKEPDAEILAAGLGNALHGILKDLPDNFIGRVHLEVDLMEGGLAGVRTDVRKAHNVKEVLREARRLRIVT
jgi:hypothetical protein